MTFSEILLLGGLDGLGETSYERNARWHLYRQKQREEWLERRNPKPPYKSYTPGYSTPYKKPVDKNAEIRMRMAVDPKTPLAIRQKLMVDPYVQEAQTKAEIRREAERRRQVSEEAQRQAHFSPARQKVYFDQRYKDAAREFQSALSRYGARGTLKTLYDAGQYTGDLKSLPGWKDFEAGRISLVAYVKGLMRQAEAKGKEVYQKHQEWIRTEQARREAVREERRLLKQGIQPGLPSMAIQPQAPPAMPPMDVPGMMAPQTRIQAARTDRERAEAEVRQRYGSKLPHVYRNSMIKKVLQRYAAQRKRTAQPTMAVSPIVDIRLRYRRQPAAALQPVAMELPVMAQPAQLPALAPVMMPLPALGYTYPGQYATGTVFKVPGSAQLYRQEGSQRLIPIDPVTKLAKSAPGIMPTRSAAPRHGREAIEFWRRARPDIFARRRVPKQGRDPSVLYSRGAPFATMFRAAQEPIPRDISPEERFVRFIRNLPSDLLTDYEREPYRAEPQRIELKVQPQSWALPTMTAHQSSQPQPLPAYLPREREERTEEALRKLGLEFAG